MNEPDDTIQAIATALAHQFWGTRVEDMSFAEMVDDLFVDVNDDGRGMPIKEAVRAICTALAVADTGAK